MQKKLEFEYKLSYEESYETFLILSLKWGKKKKNLLAAILTVLAVILLIVFYCDNRKIHYFMLAILDILLLSYLIYMPVLKAKKGAKKVSRQNGVYKVELDRGGQIKAGGETLPLAGDKDARMVETDTLFAIRSDNLHTFCLPKRIMTKEEIEEIRRILKKYL